MAYISQFEYYGDTANYGSYQYVSLEDIVRNYMLMNTGNHSLVNNEPRYKILFHAKRAIQELNYDAFKEIKALLLDCDDNLKFILPSDYVNWVRISHYSNGVLKPLTENIQATTAKAYLQNTAGVIQFDGENIEVVDPSLLDSERIAGTNKSIYLNQDSPFYRQEGYEFGGNWYFDYTIGARYGLNTETANENATFGIDKKSGVINFSSDMSGQKCLLEYISDGMENGDDSVVHVNKLFEKYVYSYIDYEITDAKLGVQEYIVNRKRRKKTAELRNAKIRISNMHPGRLLMNMRGQQKILK